MVADKKPEKLKLKSEVGLLGGVSLVAGVMVGSGIFMSPQYVLLYTGSPGASLLIWAASGLLAMAASFCYAELGTVIRESGGDYIYILRTSGNLMAFIFSFTTNFVVRPSSTIAVALTFAQNVLASFYDDCAPPIVAVKCLAAAGIVILTAMNCMNVRSSVAVTVFFTAVKILALLVILIGGIVLLIQGNTSSSLQHSFDGTKLGVSAIATGFYQCLWSYDGWNTLNNITEEIKHPQKRVKSLGHWYDASLKDKEQVEQLRKEVASGLENIDRTLQAEALVMRYGLLPCLPCLLWPLTLYDVTLSKVEKLERLVSSHVRMLHLPITSLVEGYMCASDWR
ncbi:b(0,+)-type amino acid transporter 1-like [Paramisgurnus dabryanus]|uniref:b(0,+)-type amino acid transporter 1-like n=1 Tax=Paramisgurnus dabryanus TaxID=90735 RepID=UPI003CCF9C32